MPRNTRAEMIGLKNIKKSIGSHTLWTFLFLVCAQFFCDAEDRAVIIKKPRTVLATAGDFNDHAFNTDRGSKLHGTIFWGWHKEELIAE